MSIAKSGVALGILLSQVEKDKDSVSDMGIE